MARIGIDLGGTKIEGLVLGDDGTERARLRIPTPKGAYEATIRGIAELVTRLTETAEVGPEVPIGFGIPGAISPATGLVKNANSTNLIGHKLDHDLEQALGRKVRIANDADCFALSEAVDGAGSDYELVFGVILGTGTGGGIAWRGEVRRGRNAIAGEWGHNPLPWPDQAEAPGPECYCGKLGCIETFLSGPGLSRDYAESSGRLLTADMVAEEARDGDPGAARALERYARRLAKSLATVINVLDPDAIVLGGGLSNIDWLYGSVPSLWGQYVFSDAVATPLLRNLHGDSSGVRGAAWLWPASR